MCLPVILSGPEVIGPPAPPLVPQAKLLEEMDQEFGVSTLVEEEFGQRRQVRLWGGGSSLSLVLVPGYCVDRGS